MADNDDRRLFRDAVAGTRPLKHPRHRPEPPRCPPRAQSRRADEREVLWESLSLDAEALGVETGEELVFRRPGLAGAVLRRLQRGQYAVRAELDLHGMTQPEAREALRQFLREALASRQRCVRIIHGKGRRSGPRGPVLKAAVNRWLRKTDLVLAFCSAPARDGGSGAIYVLLGD